MRQEAHEDSSRDHFVVSASWLTRRPDALFGPLFVLAFFEVFVLQRAFSSGFEHLFSACVFRFCFFVDFGCVAMLLFSVPQLLLFLARFMLEGPF